MQIVLQQVADLCSELPLLVVRPDTAAFPTTSRSSGVACEMRNHVARAHTDYITKIHVLDKLCWLRAAAPAQVCLEHS